MHTIIRPQYTVVLNALRDKNVIKVITGIRRCGKSTLLEMQRDTLKKQGANTIYYNFEDADNVVLSDWQALYKAIIDQCKTEEMNYIFLDEVQMISGFERLVDALFVKKNTDIYITGSNAFLLSSGLATLLSGRYFEINVLPFSYKEYKESLPDATLNDYMQMGGMPGAVDMLSIGENYTLKYLNDIYNSVILQDVITRSNITNPQELFAVTRFAFDTIGSPLSPNSISKYLKNENNYVDSRLVFKLIEALKDAFILYESKRYDIKGKEQLRTISKFYLVDLGFRRMLLGKPKTSDAGHLLENIVYFELLRRGYKVWTGKYNSNEIDFVAQNEFGAMEYFQVAYTAKEESTLQIELAAFNVLKDNYRKVLLTTDELEFNNDGIEILNVEKWLLG
ncbi:MAG: ATP-binding protein [Chitinophagales bacterium]|nr:ATP-binding protein [Chitinophagales bacterium]